MTSTVTSEFRTEYEHELEQWLRRRFLWYCGVIIGLTLATFAVLTLLSSLVLFFPAILERDGVSVSTGGPGMSVSIDESGGDPALDLGEADVEPAMLDDELIAPEEQGLLAESAAPEDDDSGPGLSDRDRTAFILSMSITGIGGLITILLYSRAFLKARRESLSRSQILSLTTRLIILNGCVSFGTNVLSVELAGFIADEATAFAAQVENQTRTIGVGGLAAILFTHLLACLFLPWTPRESLRPIVPLLGLNAILAVVYSADNLRLLILTITLSPAVGLPGWLVAWFRYSRFRKAFHFKMLRGRYGEMKRELLDARRLHESLFPVQMHDGPVTMRYAYEPMREIGGDFLFAKRTGDSVHAVLIDVTGHGVGAALTVNRLHGELERQFGVEHDPDPASVLHGLNEYLHFALASHSVYATALCMRVDAESGVLEYASAGHPPAFHRTADGRVARLESTTLVLGVVHPEDFDAAPEKTDFMRGDAVIAYTDGATEAVTQTGKMIRVDGLERIAMKTAPRPTPSRVASRQGAPSDEQWCDAVLQEVHRLRSGPTLDDTLIVELRRPV